MESSYGAAAASGGGGGMVHRESGVDMDTSRPMVGFPLGTALLLIVIFSLSGIFSCCYHWEKIKSVRRRSLNNSSSDDREELDVENPSHDSKPSPPPAIPTHKIERQCLPVLMPGDRIPMFIALPCPRQPP